MCLEIPDSRTLNNAQVMMLRHPITGQGATVDDSQLELHKNIMEKFFSFLKIRVRQLCLNGRKGCNSIVTYYGFTILDLLREREGDSEQRSLDAALLPLFIDFRSKYPSGHNSRAPVNRHLQTICST